jgi:hypothetical protein
MYLQQHAWAKAQTKLGQIKWRRHCIFCPPFWPPSKKFISHWERLKATQAFCRYRKMYGL